MDKGLHEFHNLFQDALLRRTALGEMGSAREPFLEIEYQAAVPDTGSTAALLGAGVFALAAARRRLE